MNLYAGLSTTLSSVHAICLILQWWKAKVLSILECGTVQLLYEPIPRLGFPQAEKARVKFVNRFYVEHAACDSEVCRDEVNSSIVMPWRFEGEVRDIDADGIDDASKPAVDVIRKELLQEMKDRNPDEQRILASKVHNALEAFKDEILREALDHKNEINDQNAQNILVRVQQRLLQDQQ